MATSFKGLLKGASILGSARIVEFVVGLVRIKLSAMILGVSGLGVFNQANFLSQKLSAFTTLSTSEALVKQLAESSEDENARKLILSAVKGYLSIILVFMVISTLVLIIASEQITEYVFGDVRYFYAFWVCLSSLPLLIANSIPYSLMRAFHDVASIAKVRVISSLVNILHTVPLIYYFKLEGAIVSVFLCHLVTVFLQYTFARRSYFERFDISVVAILSAEKNTKFIKEIIQFSGFGVTIGIYVIISEFACRAIVVKQLGMEAIGLYSPVIMWATLFTGFLIPALTTYLFSSLCKVKNNSEISIILNNGLRLASVALMPLLFLAIPYRDLIITFFYSSEFSAAEKYLPFHLLGVAFHVWFSVLGNSMASTGKIKQHGIFRFMFLTTDILVTYYCVMHWGLWGWMAKHIVSPVIFYFVYYFYCRRNMQFSLDIKNLVLMVYVFLCAWVLILVEELFEFGPVLNYFLGPSLLCTSFFILTHSEKRALYSIVFRKFVER